MSVRPSTVGSPIPCSGLMYAGVPMAVPALVRFGSAAAAVGVVECARHFTRQSHGFRNRQPPIALEPLLERLALDERHGIVGKPEGVARGEKGYDVRVGERGGELD